MKKQFIYNFIENIRKCQYQHQCIRDFKRKFNYETRSYDTCSKKTERECVKARSSYIFEDMGLAERINNMRKGN